MSKFKMNKRVVCSDGFAMSVQARATSYCSPRRDDAEHYESVEIGYPNRLETLLLHYAEDPENPEGTVYGWVPVSLVTLVIAKHGGMIAGEVPPGVAPLLGSDL
tara:strand:- start:1763 stop:2074 length:312 start_codon:yes stop_codon:yes gene_type:complete